MSVRCSGGLPWRALRVGLPALAAGVAAAWALGHGGQPVAWALPVMLGAAAIGWRVCRVEAVELRWDGQRWTADGVAGELELMIDAGAGLLLRLRPDGGAPARWIAVGRAEAGPAMPALRAAAYAHAPRQARRGAAAGGSGGQR